ncbi:hypothetical protein [Halostreptopolyspora alba]|uniref:DUF4352 domain-containing protein n=1 Tax=Halostreptopolyspora alba TaxID=2487137 RepID=A0A3N0EEG3_9ACTN|nr:hypothetical protein EFW17_06700 [Nocardiopsaceae bacterium YIM 96095]
MESSVFSPRVALVLVSSALLLSGCGLGDDDGGGEETSEPVNAGKVDPGEEESRETLASQDVNTLGTDLHIAVHELARGGETVELTFSVTNIGDEQSELVHGWLGSGGDRDVSKVKLVDSTNGKVHLVARDADDACVCSSYDGSETFDPNESILYSATFGAPPEDVETMNVQIPNAGTFNDVELS